jgi:hypothetical protein
MDPLKSWLMSNKLATECGIGDLGALMRRLDGFQSVSFTHAGNAYSYTIEEIRERAQYESGDCPVCRQKDIEIAGLKAQLNEEPAEPLRAIIKQFIDTNYTVAFERVYSRRVLCKEIDAFLLKNYNRRINRDSPLWKYVIDKIVCDRSKTYQRLKLQKREHA